MESNEIKEESISVTDLTEELNKARTEQLKELGYAETLRMAEGSNIITLWTKKNVKKIATKFGTRYLFECSGIVNEGKCVMASPYLAEMILREFAKNQNDEQITLNILKVRVDGKTIFQVSQRV
jgi:hypothetical protein